MKIGTNPWTPDMVRRLVALAPDHTGEEIARTLKMTRCAVLAKLNRLGVKPGGVYYGRGRRPLRNKPSAPMTVPQFQAYLKARHPSWLSR
jgi:hypothetical protein